MNSLHIFGQNGFHDEVFIVGTADDLAKLAETINTADSSIDGRSEADFFVADGEGYKVIVLRASEEDMDKLAVPYYDEYAQEKRDDALSPGEVYLKKGFTR